MNAQQGRQRVEGRIALRRLPVEVVNKGASDALISNGQIWREANRFKGNQYIEALRQHLVHLP